jgi:hypothetical protein
VCTVSIIALSAGSGAYRLVTNRDEQRARAPGEPPAWRTLGGVKAIAPRDPVGGGTWVATTESGLTLCLLNGNLEPAPPPPARPRTRGEIIGLLLGLGSIDAIIAASSKVDVASYPPFRLVCVESGAHAPRIADMVWDGRAIAWTPDHVAPACFVSSGLGDSRVAPRLPLFAETVGRTPTPESQDAFHRHVWPERPEISVCMSREDARTVSITSITVQPSSRTAAAVTFAYQPVGSRASVPLASATHVG